MKFSQKRLAFLQKVAILGAIFLTIFVTGYYAGFFRENCNEDTSCFDSRAKDCKPVLYVTTLYSNVYQYVVHPGLLESCYLDITLVRVNPGVQPELQALEGKEMRCTLTKERMETLQIRSFDQFLKECHGPLKEGLYEIIVQRMYGTFISHMGDVIDETKAVLKK